jgi:hypothetical protein
LVIQFKNCPNLGDCIVLLRGEVYTKPGEWTVMYMCVKGITTLRRQYNNYKIRVRY